MPGQEFHHTITIQGYHIDALGHVNNAVYLNWMDEARTKLLDDMGFPLASAMAQGVCPIIARTEIDYLPPIVLGGDVHVVIWFSSLRRASLVVQFRFYNREGVLCARGLQKGLFIHLDDGTPWRVAPDVRDRLGRYLVQA